MHELPLESTAFFWQKMLQLNREARACILKQRKYDPDNLCGTQLLRIKASQQKKERSLQHISMKLGLVFLWAPLKLCQFTPAEKPPLPHQCIAPGFEQLSIWKTHYSLNPKRYLGSQDWVWSGDVTCTSPFLLTFKCAAAFPAEPGKLQTFMQQE